MTGGRLSYSTYTLEGCEQAYHDQLEIDVERATKELKEENDILKGENFTFEELIKTQEELINKYKRALEEIQSVIKSLENENIVTFPDLSLQQNVKVIMGQCNSGYKDILNIINKVKE